MLYPEPFHLAGWSGTRPLLSIPGKRSQRSMPLPSIPGEQITRLNPRNARNPSEKTPQKSPKNRTTQLPSTSHFHFSFTWHILQAIAYSYLLLVPRPNRSTLSILPTGSISQQTTLCHATLIGGKSWAATSATSNQA